MNKKIAFVCLAVGIALLFTLLYFDTNTNKISKVCFQKTCFSVEIADTQEERASGLMYRDFLEKDSGMLFIFDEERFYPFWMKNTKINLDIIWINSENKIVDIQEAEPCVIQECPNYNPKGKALYVLEINQGISKENNFNIGDEVNLIYE